MRGNSNSGYVASLALMTAFVALTASAKLRTWSLSDYVQDGLVFHFDGILNAGAEAPHDAEATTWRNVAPNATDAATRVRLDAGADLGEWTENGYRFRHGAYFQTLPSPTSIGCEFTAQLLTGEVTLPVTSSFQAVSGDSGVDFCAIDNTEQRTHFYATDLVGRTVYPSTMPWSGLYWNAALDANGMYECDGTSWSAANMQSKALATPPNDYGTPAFKIGAKNTSYAMTGVIHFFRLYNRKLTDAELAKNRQLDDVRYFGKVVTNVVVGVSELGFCGAEDPGVYAIDGVHTFTASAVTRGLATFEPVGYWLETWNAQTGRWGAGAYHSGASCERAEGDAVVRLTWVWRCTSGLRTAADFSIDDYVSDNLVCAYDGILNAGRGAEHDAAATVWRDISGRNGSASLVIGSNPDLAGGWTAMSYAFAGGAKFVTGALPDIDKSLTMQVACNVAVPPAQQGVLLRGRYAQKTYVSNSGSLYFERVTGGVRVFNLAQAWKGDYWTGIYDGTTAYSMSGTDFASAEQKSFEGSNAEPDFEIGGYGSGEYLIGDLYAVRFYNTGLTEEQLRQNRQADAARFHGVLATTNVLVAANANGVDGVVPAGAYATVGDYTFTATNVVKGLLTYEPVGYWVEFLAPDGSYGSGHYSEGSSYTHFADDPCVRLTWVWERKGLLTAADFTVKDYVQEGFVAFFDGILNAGADKPHSDSAAKWTDCFAGHVATLSTSGMATPASGEWTETGYSFVGGDHFLTPYLKPDLNKSLTIQVALSAEVPAVSSAAALKGKGGMVCALVYSGEDKVHWDLANVGGANMPSLTGWKGDYWTGAMDEDYIYETCGTDWSTETLTVARTKKDAYVDADFEIGGPTSYPFVGTIYGIRFYSRKLTSAELLQNRQVDSARYHGVLATTNVVVAVGRYGLVGDVPAGAYMVAGGHTFTARPQEIVHQGEKVLAQPVGYTLSRLVDGVWSAPEYHEGTSYEYAEAGVPQKLTWRYSLGQGLMVIVR